MGYLIFMTFYGLRRFVGTGVKSRLMPIYGQNSHALPAGIAPLGLLLEGDFISTKVLPQGGKT